MISNGFTTLTPIDLDELVETAALQTRVDRKYILDRASAEDVLSRLDDRTRVLDIGGRRAFAYESVYFDTPDLLSYRMAATARRRRFKLRTRTYVDTHRSFLEVKTRGARATTVKDRIDYELARRDVLTDEGRDYAAGALTSIGVEAPDELALRPTLATRYDRTTLLLTDGGRGTVDTALEWEDESGSRLRRDDLVIVETKSACHISGLDRLLWQHGHRPSTVSKYATGLAALRPDLPSNKWRPVLRRHFPTSHAA